MDSEFCLLALPEAQERYGKPEVFNTDKGSQFTSRTFTGQLAAGYAARWTGVGAAWTTCSSNGCGGR